MSRARRTWPMATARATGQVGVALATSGPGATNLVTGLATAMMDSSPMVAITGQVPRGAIGSDAFQETDVTGVTLPVTKHNYLVMDVHELPYIVREAFYIARTGRPGPVLIDIPKDVQTERIEFVYPDRRDPPARLSSAGRRARRTGGGYAGAHQQGEATGHSGRPRHHDGERGQGTARTGRTRANPGSADAAGQGCYS